MAEVVKNKGQMRTYMRQLYLDIDTVDQALTDGQCDNLLNDWYHTYMYQLDRAVVVHDPITFNAAQKTKVLNPASESLGTVHNNLIRFTRATVAGVPLNRIEYDTILIKQFNSGYAATGTPTEYAIEQVNPGSGNAPQPMTFNVSLYPIPNGTITLLLTSQEVVDDLIADSDQPRLTAAETNWICRMAAGDAAYMTGADNDFIQAILRPVPNDVQARMQINQNFTLPRPQRAAKEQS